MSYVFAFAPWIVYAVIPESHWQWGALAALAVTLVLLVRGLAQRRPPSALIVELGSVIFFAGAATLAFADPHTALHPYLPAISHSWLALISWFSLAIRQPWTLGIAKQTTPREVWNQPMFLRTNDIITLAWAISFSVGAVVLGTFGAVGAATGAVVTVQVLSFAIPMTFTFRYVAVVKARVEKIHAAQAAAANQYGRAGYGRAAVPQGEWHDHR
jgi:hypothetical protein